MNMSSDLLAAQLPAKVRPPKAATTPFRGQEMAANSFPYVHFSLPARNAGPRRAKSLPKTMAYARRANTTSNDVCPFSGHIVHHAEREVVQGICFRSPPASCVGGAWSCLEPAQVHTIVGSLALGGL